MLTYEAIVESKTTFAIEKVPLPAWAQICNCTPAESFLYARTIGGDRAGDVRRISEQQEARKKAGATDEFLDFAEWACLGACDEKGEPFFTVADIPALRARPLMPLVDLANATMKLNGIIKDEPAKQEGASKDAPKAG